MSDATVPKVMQAAVLYDVDTIIVEERPVPVLASGEMLVKTQASGICTGDIMGWYVKRKAPLVLGHEPAGIVAAVGLGDPPVDENGSPFSVGDRVFVHHHAPCFACEACSREDYVQCATWRASKIDPGGLAEYFRVPKENIRDTLRLPEGVSFSDASLVEPLGCVVKSLRRGGLEAFRGEGASKKRDARPKSILIIGLGVMGLMHVAVGADRGAQVFGSDFNAERRKIAEHLGAKTASPEEIGDLLKNATAASGADIVICGPGAIAPLKEAIALAAPGGTVVMFTPVEPGETLTIDPNDLYFRDVRFVTSYSCGPNDTRESLSLITRGVVTAERVHAKHFALSEVPDAYRKLSASRIIKPIVIF